MFQTYAACRLEMAPHSTLSGIETKLEKLSMGPLWDERACFRGLQSILFEILDLWPSEKAETL